MKDLEGGDEESWDILAAHPALEQRSLKHSQPASE